MFGEGLSTFDVGLEEYDINLLQRTCTRDDLRLYYSNWCKQLHSQRLMQRFDVEEQDLDNAFSRLPQLEEICFNSGYGGIRDVSTPITSDLFSSFGQKMLVEPKSSCGYEYHVGQFTSMIAAAHKNKKDLKVIDAIRLQSKAFNQNSKVSTMMTANMRKCERFSVALIKGSEESQGESQIGSMISNAPYLQTIRVEFLTNQHESIDNAVDLSKVFVHQNHWPSLKIFQLGGFSTSEGHLKDLFKAHTTSLRAPRLSEINLVPTESKEGLYRNFWIEFIHFLRQSLQLEAMEFHKSLMNGGHEAWFVPEPKTRTNPAPGKEGLTFKDRVEKYVVGEGESPFVLWPKGTADRSRWRSALLEFQTNLDDTWQLGLIGLAT